MRKIGKPLEKFGKPLEKAESHWRNSESHWRKRKAIEESRKPIWVNRILCKENRILGEENWTFRWRKSQYWRGKSRDSQDILLYLAVFENCFSYTIGSTFGSMCAHGFLIWKYSTHNLKYNILTIRLLLRQPGVESSVVCFSKDVKVPVKVSELSWYLFFQHLF